MGSDHYITLVTTSVTSSPLVVGLLKAQMKTSPALDPRSVIIATSTVQVKRTRKGREKGSAAISWPPDLSTHAHLNFKHSNKKHHPHALFLNVSSVSFCSLSLTRHSFRLSNLHDHNPHRNSNQHDPENHPSDHQRNVLLPPVHLHVVPVRHDRHQRVERAVSQ